MRVRLKGAPEETATFARKTDARAWAQKIEVAIRERRHFPQRATRTKTLGELLDRYDAEVLSRRTKGRDKLRMLLARWSEELLQAPDTPDRASRADWAVAADLYRCAVPLERQSRLVAVAMQIVRSYSMH